jgi:hemoglobin
LPASRFHLRRGTPHQHEDIIEKGGTEMGNGPQTLYRRLGGYDAIAALLKDLLGNLRADRQLGRFWANRGTQSLDQELQLLIDFFCSHAGGPVYYMGHDVQTVHRGMHITESDWKIFLDHAAATMKKFAVPDAEQRELVAFVQKFKKDIVE